jgi:hypothetical protein
MAFLKKHECGALLLSAVLFATVAAVSYQKEKERLSSQPPITFTPPSLSSTYVIQSGVAFFSDGRQEQVLGWMYWPRIGFPLMTKPLKPRLEVAHYCVMHKNHQMS